MDLAGVPIYDHHAHALFRESIWRGAPLEPYFTEAGDPVVLREFARDGLFFRRSIRDLAEHYGCAATVEAVLAARRAVDYLHLCRGMFRAAGISHWLVDDGLWTGELWTVDECARLLPPRVGRIVRLEAELEAMIERHDAAGSLLSAFASSLRALTPRVAAFKSIAAYRSGLDIGRPARVAVEAAFTEIRRGLVPGRPPRLAAKPLVDAMLWVALGVAADTGTPVQFHTGYGDPDLDLRLASPLHLRPFLEAPELRGLRVVFLHCYPFVREAGYLASVYPGAYLDLGLTIPYTSVDGMRTAMREALHLAPITKLLFSSDAQRTPELFWLAARWGRRVIGEVLERTIEDGDLDRAEAAWAAARILHGNAHALYGEPSGAARDPGG
ncbi:MAG: amidohydrolase family protein [Candidatus Rokubacteria bacterium]|nr:amidohydrolase family protein [Candidatus Rokubacteria bacterium]